MNKYASLFAFTLLLANSPASAEDDRSADLRYCLDLPTDLQIAKCAGEIAAGNKGTPLSKEAVKHILSSDKTSAPASANAASGTPATSNDKSGKALLPEKTEDPNH